MWTSAQREAYDTWRTSPPKEWEAQEAREDAIDTETQILTEKGGDCYHFSINNFIEYLADYATDEQRQELINLVLENAEKVPNLVKGCEAYWYKEAREIAKAMIDNGEFGS
jgi:hypothetical protein